MCCASSKDFSFAYSSYMLILWLCAYRLLQRYRMAVYLTECYTRLLGQICIQTNRFHSSRWSQLLAIALQEVQRCTDSDALYCQSQYETHL